MATTGGVVSVGSEGLSALKSNAPESICLRRSSVSRRSSFIDRSDKSMRFVSSEDFGSVLGRSTSAEVESAHRRRVGPINREKYALPQSSSTPTVALRISPYFMATSAIRASGDRMRVLRRSMKGYSADPKQDGIGACVDLSFLDSSDSIVLPVEPPAVLEEVVVAEVEEEERRSRYSIGDSLVDGSRLIMCLHAARIFDDSILSSFCFRDCGSIAVFVVVFVVLIALPAPPPKSPPPIPRRRYSMRSPKSMARSPFRKSSMRTHPREKTSISGVRPVGTDDEDDEEEDDDDEDDEEEEEEEEDKESPEAGL